MGPQGLRLHHFLNFDVVKVMISTGCLIDELVDKVLHEATTINRGFVVVLKILLIQILLIYMVEHQFMLLLVLAT